MYVYVKGIYDVLIRFINYSDGMVLFGFHFLFLHYCLLFLLLELFMVFVNLGDVVPLLCPSIV